MPYGVAIFPFFLDGMALMYSCMVACIHTHLCMYLIPSPADYAARTGPDELEVVGTAERSTREWLLGPHRTISTTTVHPGL